jgi:serine O-acetyltransferase
MNIEEIEQAIRKEAEKLVHDEPLSVLMLTEQVLNCKDFSAMLSVTLSCQLAGEVMDRTEEWARVTYYRVKQQLIKEIQGNENKA